MKINVAGIMAGRKLLKTVVIKNIQKVAATIGVRQTLKYLSLNFQQFTKLKRNISCISSIFNLCRIKHPAQLLQKEINIVKTYCLKSRYQFWPLYSSVSSNEKRWRCPYDAKQLL